MAKQRSSHKPRRDIYQEITDRILELLDQGTVPWHNPIRRGTGDGWPKNLQTDRRYRGINVFLLAVTAWERGYASDYWLTYRQADALGGNVRQGEKSSLVTFWKLYDTTDNQSGEDVTLPVLRHYNVFSVEQCAGIKIPDAGEKYQEQAPFEPLQQAETIMAGYEKGPTITHGGSRACYRPSIDEIVIAEPERFEQPESYYSTLFHEAVHSTGHSSRLKRGLDAEAPAPFGSTDYSKEELIAEMGASFLNAAAGISPPTIEQSAAYIDNWRKQLKDDKRLVVQAAGSAQRAADWILGETFTEYENKSKSQIAEPDVP